MLHGRRRARVVAHRTNAGIEIENLPQGHVKGTNSAPHRSRERSLDGNTKFADRVYSLVGKPVIELGFGFLSGKDFKPRYLALTPVGLLDSGVEHSLGSPPDVASGAVALNERNDRILRDLVLPAAIADLGAVCRHHNPVIRTRHENPP